MVTPFELAWACRLYGPMAGFDSTLAEFRKQASPAFDAHRPAHRDALFRWLNSWGCRQFAKAHHAGIASDSLVRWATTWLHRLPEPGVPLTDLEEAGLRVATAAYADLQASVASERAAKSGTVPVTYGPTGAAKTLFALRPDVFPPWDDPIRRHFRYDGSEPSFNAHLTRVATTLTELATEAKVGVASLPALVGRPDSSPPKLIDEYDWVVLTRGLTPPTLED